MERIIAARFQTVGEADAVAALMSYIDSADISIFHNSPPGQHGVLSLGGDEDEDPSAAGAGKSAATTAVSAGLAAGAVGALGGPVVALAAAAVGAYTGSPFLASPRWFVGNISDFASRIKVPLEAWQRAA